jgi:hypothetical protein
MLGLNKLPVDVIIKISGYYGQQIAVDLSQQIFGQQILNSIKETHYYKRELRYWDLSGVLHKFLAPDFAKKELKQKIYEIPWNKYDQLINKIWWSYTPQQQRHIFQTYFPQVLIKETAFITGGVLMGRTRSTFAQEL